MPNSQMEKVRTRPFMLRMPTEVYEQLRELSYHERRPMAHIVLEILDQSALAERIRMAQARSEGDQS